MMALRDRFRTAILVALPLLVVTSVVCPMCSASTMGVEVASSCGRFSSAEAPQAGAAVSPRNCHSTGAVVVHGPAADASCCLIEAAESMKQPAAVQASAPVSSVALLATRQIRFTPSPLLRRAPSTPSRPLDEPLYTLHRALLI